MTACTGYVKNFRTEAEWLPIRCVKVAACWSPGWEHLTAEEIVQWNLTRGEESRQAVLRERAARSQPDDPIETGLEASLGQAEQRIEELNAELSTRTFQLTASRLLREQDVGIVAAARAMAAEFVPFAQDGSPAAERNSDLLATLINAVEFRDRRKP